MENDNKKEYLISIFTENSIGVLNRITTIFLRRKINIESLKVSESSIKGISMFIITAFCSEETVKVLIKQIERLVDVIRADYHDPRELITHEVAIYKISPDILSTKNIDIITTKSPTRILEVNKDYVVVEKSGSKSEIDQLKQELRNLGMLLQFTRTGSLVLYQIAMEEDLFKKQE